jgi:hypothetical protein
MIRWLLLLALACGLLGLAGLALATGGQGPDPDGENQPLKLPDWWKAGDPLPHEKTNCVRCHLTAGRELTVPVRDFARSAHDRSRLSCHDCHGGNTEKDSEAHEAQHDFIGTKLSAHMAACAACHSREAQTFRKSKHYWDLTKSINRKYPVCVDCHGNHDVGKPPADFSLTNVCTDCHKQFAKDQPNAAAVVAENDRLWQVLRQVHTQNQKAADPTPAPFRDEVDSVRSATARLMHRTDPITGSQTQALNDRMRRLRDELETWLKEQK